MSGQAGILMFDPRDSISHEAISILVRSLEATGPDRAGEYSRYNLGMAYRAFHTTNESCLSEQPLEREGFVLTLDGRLDNRDEVGRSTGPCRIEDLSDAELVLSAYRKFGLSSFAMFLGDWALALWDPERFCLILARDVMGVRRLFYRVDSDGITWSSTLEPLVQTAPRKLRLDLDYLSGCIYPRPSLETTPFQEIRTLPPGSFLTCHMGGKIRIETFWNLAPDATIRYADDREYEEHFRDLILKAVSRRLRSNGPIVAELSGGVDSSSLVCAADLVSLKEHITPVTTISYFDDRDAGGDERPFFSLIEQHRGQMGHHLRIADIAPHKRTTPCEPAMANDFCAYPGETPASRSLAEAAFTVYRSAEAKVVLSGLGGDELLGGISYEAPELAGYLEARQLGNFFDALAEWSLRRKKSRYRLAWDSIELLAAARWPTLLLDNPKPYDWASIGPPQSRHFKSFARWSELSPAQAAIENVRHAVAQQLTWVDLPHGDWIERRYPYLDRELFTFLASIPRTQIVRAGKRRNLMRRALRGIVPDAVLLRKSKWFSCGASQEQLCKTIENAHELWSSPWLSEGLLVHSTLLRERIALVEHGAVPETRAVHAALMVEMWLRGPIAGYVTQ